MYLLSFFPYIFFIDEYFYFFCLTSKQICAEKQPFDSLASPVELWVIRSHLPPEQLSLWGVCVTKCPVWMQTGCYDRSTFTNRKHFNPSHSAVCSILIMICLDFSKIPHSQQYCMQIWDLCCYACLLLDVMKHGRLISFMRWKLFSFQSSLSGDVWVFPANTEWGKFIVLPYQSGQREWKWTLLAVVLFC